MKIKLVVLSLVMPLLAGCAIYDSKNGPLVTSSPVEVVSSDYPRDFTVNVEDFVIKSDHMNASNSSLGMVGIPLIVTHEYIFNTADQENIRKSVLQSLSASDVPVRQNAPTKLSVVFDYVGMGKPSYGYVVPVFKGTIYVTSEREKFSKPFLIIGDEKMTVVGSKESGIEKFVELVHDTLLKNNVDDKPS